MLYENLLLKADEMGLVVKDKPLQSSDGRICGNKIAIRQGLEKSVKCAVLAEEIGHFKTGAGNILNQSTIEEQKQECKARRWGYDLLVGLEGIINAYEAGCSNLFEMSKHLCISADFLSEALQSYKERYGIFVEYQNYIIYFSPSLAVFKMFESEGENEKNID